MWKHLRKFRNLGIFGEDPVERLHHTDNKYNRLFNNIKTFEGAEKAKLIRQSTEDIPAVKEILDNQIQQSKRRLSGSTVERKKNKQQRQKEVKEESSQHVKKIAEDYLTNNNL